MVRNIGNETIAIQTKQIVQVCVFIEILEECYIATLPNIYHYFYIFFPCKNEAIFNSLRSNIAILSLETSNFLPIYTTLASFHFKNGFVSH